MGPLTGAITLDQSGPGSNSNEGVTPHFPELESFNQLQFNVIPRLSILDGVYSTAENAVGKFRVYINFNRAS